MADQATHGRRLGSLRDALVQQREEARMAGAAHSAGKINCCRGRRLERRAASRGSPACAGKAAQDRPS